MFVRYTSYRECEHNIVLLAVTSYHCKPGIAISINKRDPALEPVLFQNQYVVQSVLEVIDAS